nr:pitrilysin family protein [uncultured Pseudomonas sp.]
MNSPPTPSTAATSPSPLQGFTLDNGLKVYLREDHRAPLVSAQLWYHVGASYEPAGHSGLSHLLEHLMFEGSSKLEPGQYSKLITLLGGEPNAFTSQDATYFPVTLPASRLEIVLEAMADAMASAGFDDATFDRELQVVLAERRLSIDQSPLAIALERDQILAHGSSAYATPVIGHQTDLESATAQAARTWYQSWYHPNNATLVVVGDVDMGRLRQYSERHFASIPRHRLPDQMPSIAPGELIARSQTVALAGLREGLLMTFNTPGQATANSEVECCALRLIPGLMMNGGSSRLYRRLINDQPVLQAMRASYEHALRGDSLMSFYMFSNPAQGTPQQAGEAVWSELQALASSGPSEAELKRAKARLLASLVFDRDMIAAQAEVIGKFAASGIDPHFLDREQHVIEQVSGEDVRRAARAYFTRERLSITYLTPEENADE